MVGREHEHGAALLGKPPVVAEQRVDAAEVALGDVVVAVVVFGRDPAWRGGAKGANTWPMLSVPWK